MDIQTSPIASIISQRSAFLAAPPSPFLALHQANTLVNHRHPPLRTHQLSSPFCFIFEGQCHPSVFDKQLFRITTTTPPLPPPSPPAYLPNPRQKQQWQQQIHSSKTIKTSSTFRVTQGDQRYCTPNCSIKHRIPMLSSMLHQPR